MLFAVLAMGTAMAQESKTVTGYVVDKNGNPLAGAEVMSAGGGASAISDADGSFTLNVHPLLKKLTASYAGMSDKTLRLDKTSDLVFTMQPQKKHPAFINAIGCVGLTSGNYDGNKESDLTGGFGVMGGVLGNWGYYGKFLATAYDGYELGIGVTVGAIKQLGKSSTYLYFGAGFNDDCITDMCFAADFGAIFKVTQHINIVAGINYSHGSDKREDYNLSNNKFLLNLGVGYVF